MRHVRAVREMQAIGVRTRCAGTMAARGRCNDVIDSSVGGPMQRHETIDVLLRNFRNFDLSRHGYDFPDASPTAFHVHLQRVGHGHGGIAVVHRVMRQGRRDR